MERDTTSILKKCALSQAATVVPSLPICILWKTTALMSALGLLLCKPQAGSGPLFLHDVPIKGFCKQLGSQSHDLFIWNLPSTCCSWHRTRPRSGYGIGIIIEHNSNFNKHLIGLLICQVLLLKLLSALEILTHLILQGVLGGRDEGHCPFGRQES